MLLCDPTGDAKVSGQRWVPWDRGGGGSPLSHWGPHLLYICWDFLFQLSCACLDDRNGHTDAGLDLYFKTVLIMNFVVLNKNSSLVGFFNGRERKDRAIVLLTKRADRGHQPTPGLRLSMTALPCPAAVREAGAGAWVAAWSSGHIHDWKTRAHHTLGL